MNGAFLRASEENLRLELQGSAELPADNSILLLPSPKRCFPLFLFPSPATASATLDNNLTECKCFEVAHHHSRERLSEQGGGRSGVESKTSGLA